MKFLVKSGEHCLSIEAIDFNQAALTFLETVSNQDHDDVYLGDVISVTCEITESWIQTKNVMKTLYEPKKLRIA